MSVFLFFPLLQEPFDLGVDSLARQRYVFNVIADKTPSNTFLEELAAILIAANLGTVNGNNRNIFFTNSAGIPEGDGPYISLIETGGPGGVKIQNQKPPAYERPGAQIVVRAKKPLVARDRAYAAYNAFANVLNQPVTAVTVS